MVDIEYLRKNYSNYEACVEEFLRDIRDRLEDYSYFKGEREDIKKEIYGDVVYLLTYLRIMDIDFSGCDFKRDMDLAMQFIKEMQRERHEENRH